MASTVDKILTFQQQQHQQLHQLFTPSPRSHEASPRISEIESRTTRLENTMVQISCESDPVAY
jgi:hypothetical protein